MRNFLLKIRAAFLNWINRFPDKTRIFLNEEILMHYHLFLSEFWDWRLPWTFPANYEFNKDASNKEGELYLFPKKDGKYQTGALVHEELLPPECIIQITAKWPKVKGLWFALWTWTLPAYREYDIVEACGEEKGIHCTGHRWGDESGVTRKNFIWGFDCEKYHTYELEIRRETVQWRVDGVLVKALGQKWANEMLEKHLLIMSMQTGDYCSEVDESQLPCKADIFDVKIIEI